MKSVANITQHASRIEALTVRWTAGVPAVVEGTSRASVADTGTGIATLTLTDPFARKPVITATCEAATGEKVTAQLRSVSQTGFILEVADESGALADSTVDVHLHVVGFDSADEA
jgi:hypothetical protein